MASWPSGLAAEFPDTPGPARVALQFRKSNTEFWAKGAFCERVTMHSSWGRAVPVLDATMAVLPELAIA